MMQLKKQVAKAQRRLWVNRWMNSCTWCVLGSAVVFALVVLVQRLFALPIPLLIVGLGLGGLALVVATVWSIVGRADAPAAAAALDEAAGLRERISSGLHCESSSDPFGKAVVADAERISESVTVRQHLRLEVPRPLGAAGLAIVAAALMFLIQPGALLGPDEPGLPNQEDAASRARVVVKRELDSLKQMAKSNEALKDFEDEFDALAKQPISQLAKPESIRHESLKSIDKLSDAVKAKRNDTKYDSVNEMRKMLRGLKAPQEKSAPTKKLNKALAQGDFKTAKEELKNLKEQLATLKHKEDKELVEKLSKQLDDLADQLEQMAQNEGEIEQKLKESGLNEEEIKRAMESLQKKDMQQLQKQLQQKGMSKQQAQKLSKQLQQKQQACSQCKQLSQSAKQGAKCNNPGQMGQAIEGMSQAQEQLGELEKLEQEMSQLDAALSEIDQAKNDIDKDSEGSGDSKGEGDSQGGSQSKGSGKGGMGNKGKGKGGAAPEAETSVSFKVHQGKVPTGKGAIIGQFLVDGEQVKGEVSSEFVEIVDAAERDASDAVKRDRVPRQYQKSIRNYFSNVKRIIEASQGKKAGGAASKEGGSKAESSEAGESRGDGGSSAAESSGSAGKETATAEGD